MEVLLKRESYGMLCAVSEQGTPISRITQIRFFGKELPRPVRAMIGSLGAFSGSRVQIPAANIPMFLKQRKQLPPLSILKENGSRILQLNLDKLGLPYSVHHSLDFNEYTGMIVSGRVELELRDAKISARGIVRDAAVPINQAIDRYVECVSRLSNRENILTLDQGLAVFEAAVADARRELQSYISLLEKEKAYTLEDYREEAKGDA